MVLGDDSGLFGGWHPTQATMQSMGSTAQASRQSMDSQDSANSQGGSPAPIVKKRKLRRGDYHSTQMFQPHGACAIEKASLAGLWSVVSKGSKWTSILGLDLHPWIRLAPLD